MFIEHWVAVGSKIIVGITYDSKRVTQNSKQDPSV